MVADYETIIINSRRGGKPYFCYTEYMESATYEQQIQQFGSERDQRREEVNQQPAENRESEHETTSKTVQDIIRREATPSFEASSHAPRSMDESLPEDEKSKLQDLLQTAESEGPYAAIKKAKDADPALLDAFHAALTGQLHDKLTQQGKLEDVR